MIRAILTAPLSLYYYIDRWLDVMFIFPAIRKMVVKDWKTLTEQRDIFLELARFHVEKTPSWLALPADRRRHYVVERAIKYFPPEEWENF